MTEAKPQAGVGFSFDIKFTEKPGGDNVVVQYYLPLDLSLDRMKEYTAKVMDVVGHEKLKYKHRELLREKQISETFISRAKEDLALKHSNLKELDQEAALVHKQSGRKGPVKYNGHLGSQQERYKQDIVSARQVLDNAEARHKHLLIELELTEKTLGINSAANSS